MRPPLELETWGKIRRTTVHGQPAAVARYRDSDGRTRLMQRQGKTPADAERRLVAAMRARLSPASLDLTGRSTVGVACERWLTGPDVQGFSTGTVRRYEAAVKSLIGDGFDGVRLSEVTVPRVDRFLQSVTKTHGPGAGKTTRTVLQHVFALAVRHGAMRSNPMRDAGKIRQPRKTPVAPTVDDVHAMQKLMRLYDATPDRRGAARTADLGDLFAMFVATGCRTAEVIALRWRDVNLAASTVSITGTAALDEDGKIVRQPHPKTDTSRRTLILPPFAADVLTRRRVDSYCQWVFPSATGTLRWPHNLRRNWREALKGTEYENVTPRALRKAVATIIRDRMGLDVARDQLGHASNVVTRKHYVQPSHKGPDATEVLQLLGESDD